MTGTCIQPGEMSQHINRAASVISKSHSIGRGASKAAPCRTLKGVAEVPLDSTADADTGANRDGTSAA